MLQFKWWYLSKCACNATRKLCPQLFRCLSYIFTYSLLTLEGRHYRTRPSYLGIEILQRLDVTLMGFKVKELILFGVLEPQNKSRISAKLYFLSKKHARQRFAVQNTFTITNIWAKVTQLERLLISRLQLLSLLLNNVARKTILTLYFFSQDLLETNLRDYGKKKCNELVENGNPVCYVLY